MSVSKDIKTQDEVKAEEIKKPEEVGGRRGLEPTRYGDWEKQGICVDF